MQKILVLFNVLGCTRLDKLKEINDYVWEKFVSVRNQRGRVHDEDLRRWAMEKKIEVNQLVFFEKNFLGYVKNFLIIKRLLRYMKIKENGID